MAEILNTFLKSKMNQDLDSRILPNGEYREAINLMISKSEGADVGEFENVLGNNQIASLLPTSGSSVIGNYVDETQNVVYVMTTDFEDIDSNERAASSNNCGIYKIDLSSPFTVSTLVLGSYLNFNKSFSIYGINLIENFLYWTDNNNQPRKINVDLAQDNFVSITNQYYLTEEQISVAKYAPYQTAVLMERSSTTVTATNAGALVMTVASNTGIKVGDIITDHNKQVTTELIETLTIVTNIAGNVISFLPALATALPASFAIDFSRPSMTNQGERNLSNHSTQTVQLVQAGGFVIRTKTPVYGGLPRAGDYITKAAGTPITFASDVKVVSFAFSNSATAFWDITVDKDVSTLLANNDVIEIARNPDYLANWKGDPTFLEDKFVRFSYRFQYDDNEYSLMAPFSQIAFIPKQYSEFGTGQLNEEDVFAVGSIKNGFDQDMVNAYKSSIIAWFENDADNINVRIPLPYNTSSLLGFNLKIKNIDILYKESDALAVKVLDTISITPTSPVFSNISYEDDLHGFVTQSFFDYNYKSSKPFKTLPQGQTTRVYDRVPVKALAQEFVGSRVVYGNYLEKLTPPATIPYNVGFDDKSIAYDNYTQYPYHTLKQNRTYQAGFVLSDIYGRQSDVILSSNDNSTTAGGSTIFLPYNTSDTQGDILAWLGKVLTMSIERPIARTVNYATGEPGIYADGLTVDSINVSNTGQGYVLDSNIATTTSGAGTGLTVAITSISNGGAGQPPLVGAVTGIIINNPGSGYLDQETVTISGGGVIKCTVRVTVSASNPLGWYSYKIVVKQQEQEYYNVFFPGFVNGLPVIPSAQTPPTYSQDLDLYAFSTIISDNINKVPRELIDVGPTDLEYNSEELLYIRINNPDSISIAVGLQGNKVPRNVQYYPNNASQNVLNISTVRDTQLVAIPFVANKEKGDYGQTINPTIGANTITSLTGAIPWGKTGANVSFYGADQNPFILQFSTSNQSLNPIGAQVTDVLSGGAAQQGTHCMAPILTVAETKPVFSLLDIYWETSTTGLITDLNRAISNTFDGVTELTQTTFTFPETIPVSNTALFVPAGGFQAVDGSGAVITNATVPPIITISSIRRVNSVSSFFPEPDFPFELVPDGAYRWRIGTTSSAVNSQFVFKSTSLPVDLVDNYVITVKVVFDGSNSNGLQTTFFTLNANLTNVAPTIKDCDTVDTTIELNNGETLKTLEGFNTSPIVSENQVGLKWNLGAVTIFNTATPAPNIFTLNSSTGVLNVGGSQNMADLTSYTLPITLTDCDGNGLSASVCNLLVSVGAQHVPLPICAGRRNNVKAATCGQNSEWLFSSSTTTGTQAGGFPYPSGAVYPPNALYNVLLQSNAFTPGCLTGALSQGRMELIINLDGGSTTPIGNVAIIRYWIQFRALSGQGGWIDATAVADGSLDTITSGNTINSDAQAAPKTLTYNFAQPGDYRVVTDYLRGTACQAGANPAFYVDFKDASYPNDACGVLNPCA